MICVMTRFLRRILGFETKLDQQVQDALDFTVKNYGESLRDLARYDRGEKLSEKREPAATR